MVSDVAAVAGFARGRRRLGFDEQAVEAARFGQRVEIGVAGPVEEGAVGIDQCVEPVDQDADRQAVEDRPAFAGVAGGIAVARRARRRDRRRRLGAEVVRRATVYGLAGRLLEPAAEFARQFLEGAALAGSERRRLFERAAARERQHIVDRCFRLACQRRRRRRIRGLRPALLQCGEPLDVAADAEAAVAFELALAVEDRQARHFDRQRLVVVVHRPGDDDAAPGVAGGKRAVDRALRIELERRGDARPRGGRARRRSSGRAIWRNLRAPSVKRLAASICQTKRNGIAARGLRRLRQWTPPARGPQRFCCACAGAAKAASKATVAPAPRRSKVTGQAAISPSARPLSDGLAGQPLGAERDQVALVAEALARLRRRLDQFAVGGEYRRGPLEIGEQPLRAVGQRSDPCRRARSTPPARA